MVNVVKTVTLKARAVKFKILIDENREPPSLDEFAGKLEWMFNILYVEIELDDGRSVFIRPSMVGHVRDICYPYLFVSVARKPEFLERGKVEG